MIRPQIIGQWPGEVRPRVDLTCEQLRAMPRSLEAVGPTAAPNGATYLRSDFYDWSRGRWLLLQATVIRGPWKYGRGAGARVPCHPNDPERFVPSTERERTTAGESDSIGYALVWSECPALDRLDAVRRAPR